jgi:hypothetical protein
VFLFFQQGFMLSMTKTKAIDHRNQRGSINRVPRIEKEKIQRLKIFSTTEDKEASLHRGKAKAKY